MEANNLKNITKLCRDIHTLCQNGTPAVRVAAQMGLEELYAKLQNLPIRPNSEQKPNGVPNLSPTSQKPPEKLEQIPSMYLIQ